MASTASIQKSGKGRKKITRTACEPCREKRAKCDGQDPCERCTNRNLDCHFTQRAWSSKRSLQDDITSLKARLEKREDLLEALLVSGTGDTLLAMLRGGEVSMEQAGDKIASARKDIKREHQHDQHRHGTQAMNDTETTWSPVTGTLRSPGAHTSISDDSFSPGFPASADENTPGIMPPPWATPNVDSGLPSSTHSRQQQSFSNMLEGGDSDNTAQQSNAMPGGNYDFLATGGAAAGGQMHMAANAGNQPPTVIDPLFWPPPHVSEPLGIPSVNSWTGLQGLIPGEVGVPV